MEYYKAYDNRYRIYHQQKGNAWAGDLPSKELKDVLIKYNANKNSAILEIGCGEGQNALYLLKEGFNVEASDVSPEAINWCKQKANNKKFENNFFVLDILDNNLTKKYDFILSISTLHMLVSDAHRKSFFDFIASHLNKNGVAIITSMGDGCFEKNDTDITKSFDLVERDNGTGKVLVPQTSCRIVNWEKLKSEIENSELAIIENYISKTISGFDNSMVAIIEKQK